jgi:hypothetical protein
MNRLCRWSEPAGFTSTAASNALDIQHRPVSEHWRLRADNPLRGRVLCRAAQVYVHKPVLLKPASNVGDAGDRNARNAIAPPETTG